MPQPNYCRHPPISCLHPLLAHLLPLIFGCFYFLADGWHRGTSNWMEACNKTFTEWKISTILMYTSSPTRSEQVTRQATLGPSNHTTIVSTNCIALGNKGFRIFNMEFHLCILLLWRAATLQSLSPSYNIHIPHTFSSFVFFYIHRIDHTFMHVCKSAKKCWVHHRSLHPIALLI